MYTIARKNPLAQASSPSYERLSFVVPTDVLERTVDTNPGSIFAEIHEAERAETDFAHELGEKGAQIIACASLEEYLEALTDNPDAYVTDSIRLTTAKAAEADPTLPVPTTLPYPAYLNLPAHRQFLPAILANPQFDGGLHKYLLETESQLDMLAGFGELGKQNHHILQGMEMRQVIPTPSDHYTSYRVLTTPTGHIIGAGLLYSQHTKSSPELLTVPESKGWTRAGDSLMNALMNPTSPYYLASKKITSNINLGGGVIPLIGEGAALPVDEKEKEILEAHGIDAMYGRIPWNLGHRAAQLGRLLGNQHALVLGLDFLQHRDTGEFYFLEGNPGPGGETFRRCWDPNRTFSTYDTRIALYRAAITDLVERRAGNEASLIGPEG